MELGIKHIVILYATTGSTAGAPQTVLSSVGNAASDIDSFRHRAILYTNSTVCIHLYYPKWSFSRTVEFPSNIFTGFTKFFNLAVLFFIIRAKFQVDEGAEGQ